MRITFIIFLLLSFITGSFAQDKKVTPLEGEGDILENQFQYIITKTERYEDYQVVKRSLLYKLKTNTLDSIKSYKTRQAELEAQVNDLQQNLDVLQRQLKETQDKLNAAVNEKDSLRFLGILLKKSTFYTIIFIIIIGLIAGLAVVFFLYKRSNLITIKTKETLATTQEEFEKHRKWALEKEQQLARDLLKEQQKNKGVM
jgi:Flp pilus assembly protein TadB